MTTCSECLSVLSTTRLSDIPGDSAVSHHVATCPNCSRLVSDMMYADQRLSLALDSSLPNTPPTTVASNAMITGDEREHRESVAKWFRRGLAIAAGIIAVAFMRGDIGRYMTGDDDFERQTIVLRCISSAQAVELATPVLRSNVGRVSRAGDLQMVTIQGKHQEVNAALDQIEQAERLPQCQLPAPKPPTITPSAGTPGKG